MLSFTVVTVNQIHRVVGILSVGHILVAVVDNQVVSLALALLNNLQVIIAHIQAFGLFVAAIAVASIVVMLINHMLHILQVVAVADILPFVAAINIHPFPLVAAINIHPSFVVLRPLDTLVLINMVIAY